MSNNVVSIYSRRGSILEAIRNIKCRIDSITREQQKNHNNIAHRERRRCKHYLIKLNGKLRVKIRRTKLWRQRFTLSSPVDLKV